MIEKRTFFDNEREMTGTRNRKQVLIKKYITTNQEIEKQK